MQQLNSGDLLIEFLTEELPPINLEQNIGAAFASALSNELKAFIGGETEYFVTPRRFGCILNQVNPITQEQKSHRKGPAIVTGLVDGKPTNALLGFVKSCQLSDWTALEQRDDGYFYAEKIIPGQILAEVLPGAIETALKKLPIAKNMRWGNNDYLFVRPMHNLMILFNNQLICQGSKILGLMPVDYTFGHRILSEGIIKPQSTQSYAEQLFTQGKVVVDFSQRKNNISAQLNDTAAKLELKINHMEGLLEEVTALVEYPVVLQGEFAPEFLQVPQECLILTMAKNQKYFALLDNNGKLSNKFLFVANIASTNPQVIIEGNQKVLAARLSDAKFFYEVDKKHQLDFFADKLKSVVYHNKLGSQFERIQRLQQIASGIAPLLQIDPALAVKTAKLLKADLTTEMVGEFPELQGVMGKYYALAQGESAEIANAIEKHYYPRFSGDELPDTFLAVTMALTDKLETLVGIWSIGLVPTGEKDPFALRRAALGVVRILLANKLDIKQLLSITVDSFKGTNPVIAEEIYQFILDRLSNYLVNIEKYTTNVVNSVLKSRIYTSNETQANINFSRILKILPIVQNFAGDVSNKELFEANKRIENILKKNSNELPDGLDCSSSLLATNEEIILFNYIHDFNQFDVQHEGFEEYFTKLKGCSEPLANFFANVMVMDENKDIRQNRLALLRLASQRFSYLCKLSELS